MKSNISFFFGAKVIENKSIFINLLRIPGIGRFKAYQICQECGLLTTVKWFCLTNTQRQSLLFWFKENFSKRERIGSNLEKYKIDKIKFFISLKLVRGIRSKRGLPVNGQRTRTNAKTAKRFKYKYK